MSEYARQLKEVHRVIAERASKYGFEITGSIATGHIVFMCAGNELTFSSGREAERFLDGCDYIRQQCENVRL